MSLIYNPPAKYGRTVVLDPDLLGGAAAGSKFNFKLDNELNERQIIAIDVLSAEQCQFSPNGNGKANVSAARLANMSITLFDKDDERYQSVPVRIFRRPDNFGNIQYVENYRFNMQDSYVRMSIDDVLREGECLVFVFWYNK